MAAAVPFALKYGIPLAAGLLGKKLSGPSKAQSTALTGTQQAGAQVGAMADPLMKQGQALTQQGQGYLGQGAAATGDATSYYRGILGDRSAANASLAPERATALEYYGGAEAKANRTMRGASRDTAVAELDRQKVGQLASYLPQARMGAAGGMERAGAAYGGLGGTALGGGASATGQGVNAAATSGYLNSGAFNQATQLQTQAQQGGQGLGKMLYDMVSQMPWGKRGGGGGVSALKIPNLFQGF